MNEETNIERIEELLLKSTSTPLSTEEIIFLESQGIDQSSIPFMAQAMSPDLDAPFLKAEAVKQKMLNHFPDSAPITSSTISSEKSTPKVFDFKPLLKYAAVFIVSLGAIATVYFMFPKENITENKVAVVEPVPNLSVPESTVYANTQPESTQIQPSNEKAVAFSKSDDFKQIPRTPAPNKPELNYEIMDDNEMAPISAQGSLSDSKLSEEIVVSAKEIESSNIENVRSNTIVMADKLSKNKKEGYTSASDQVGPYPGGFTQLKVDLKKTYTATKNFPENSHVSLKVIPDGKGNIAKVVIVKTNDQEFANAIAEAIYKNHNWEVNNSQPQSYLFFAIDFNSK